MTVIRLACAESSTGHYWLERARELNLNPSVLVSYFYLKKPIYESIKKIKNEYVLDSGAFSAWNSKKEIDIIQYAEECCELMKNENKPVEIYSLDVIGDSKKTQKNTEYLWSKGIQAIPTFHVGEPEDYLIGIARDYPKIAFGGAVGFHGKYDWAKQCMLRIWPKKVHGFGFGCDKLFGIPFHSADASNWVFQTSRYNYFKSYGKQVLNLKKANESRFFDKSLPKQFNINLIPEIEYYLKLEKNLKQHFKKEMALLETL